MMTMVMFIVQWTLFISGVADDDYDDGDDDNDDDDIHLRWGIINFFTALVSILIATLVSHSLLRFAIMMIMMLMIWRRMIIMILMVLMINVVVIGAKYNLSALIGQSTWKPNLEIKSMKLFGKF